MSWGWNLVAGVNMVSSAVTPFGAMMKKSVPKPNFGAMFNAVNANVNSDIQQKIEPLCEEPPDRVSARYRDDLNITMIHEAIISRFAYLKTTIQKKRDEISFLHSQSRNVTLNTYNEIMDKINTINKQIVDIDNDILKNIYLKESEPFLVAYKEVAKSRIVNVKDGGFIQESSDKIEKRCGIIEEYLDIARKCIIIDVIRIIDNKSSCPSCGKRDENPPEDIEGFAICECGYSTETLSNAPSYKDSTRINSGCRNNYENRENFYKALLRYQGKQPRKPPTLLYKLIDEYAVSIGNPTGEYIRTLPLNQRGTKDHTSKHMMIAYLHETNNSAYYEDINLICHVYWGWDLPDISHLEDQIMNDYERTQEIYNAIPNKDRIASLNIQFRLYVHLRSLDVPCEREDFKMQVQRESLLFHQECWNKMCADTGIKSVEVI